MMSVPFVYPVETVEMMETNFPIDAKRRPHCLHWHRFLDCLPAKTQKIIRRQN